MNIGSGRMKAKIRKDYSGLGLKKQEEVDEHCITRK
jgi:hypothetical protein